jgi:hypothetical protein
MNASKHGLGFTRRVFFDFSAISLQTAVHVPGKSSQQLDSIMDIFVGPWSYSVTGGQQIQAEDAARSKPCTRC